MGEAITAVEREPNEMQAAFVFHYTNTPGCIGNGAAAARAAGYSDHSARDIAAGLLRKPHVREALVRYARERLAHLAPMAIETLREFAANPDKYPPRVSADAAKALLDRAGFSVVSADRKSQEDDAREKPDSAKTLAELDAEIEQRMAERRRREAGLQVVGDAEPVER